MANNVIGLFENESVAESVVEELVASGFNRNTIKRFRGNNDQLEDELRREGIPADEASYYVNGLNEGGALVSVRAEESETDSAVDIMNRYVNTGQSGAEDTGVADTSYTETEYGEASYQGSDAGWDETVEGGKSVDADGADYDGAGSGVVAAAGGATVGRAAYEAYNKERREQQGGSSLEADSMQAESHASTSPFPIGREAYATYTRRQPAAAESEAFSESSFAEDTVAESAPSMGFPIGREAYAAYTKKPSAPTDEAVEESPDSWTETVAQPSGFPIGREAYEAYSREKAEKWNS